jgi:hypothetical protein
MDVSQDGESLESFLGTASFRSEDEKASLEDAFEQAARAAADRYGDNTELDVRLTVVVRKENQHVKTYKVTLTPRG